MKGRVEVHYVFLDIYNYLQIPIISSDYIHV